MAAATAVSAWAAIMAIPLLWHYGAVAAATAKAADTAAVVSAAVVAAAAGCPCAVEAGLMSTMVAPLRS